MMYLRHFALREAPFSITPDPAYFFLHFQPAPFHEHGTCRVLNQLVCTLGTHV